MLRGLCPCHRRAQGVLRVVSVLVKPENTLGSLSPLCQGIIKKKGWSPSFSLRGFLFLSPQCPGALCLSLWKMISEVSISLTLGGAWGCLGPPGTGGAPLRGGLCPSRSGG